MKPRTILMLSGLLGALGILIGAFGAHALPKLLQELDAETIAEREAWLKTGVQYHMYHVVALLAVGLSGYRGRNFSLSALAWTLGILLFSGSLYVMTMTGIRVLGAVVPLGGVAFVIGWIFVAVRARASSD